MDKIQSWDVVIDPGTGYTSKPYHEWRSAVARVRDMSEGRARKLYRAGFTPDDIAQDKHWSMFPPDRESRIRKVVGLPEGKRGRCLGEKKRDWIYARALRDAAQGMLAYYRTDSAMRAALTDDVEKFGQLMKKYSHNGK